MKFEVNKFLALTALLAGTAAVAAGCSSSDAKSSPPGSSGDAGDAGEGPVKPTAGTGNTSSDGGAAGASDAQGGAVGAGDAQGGAAGEGGASEGGAAGASEGSCIADLVGAGGAADEAICDALGAAGAPDCAGEGNFAAQGCLDLSGSSYRPSVVEAYKKCASALADTCDRNSVLGCALGLIGQGCTQPGTAEAAALVKASCPGVSASLCTGILDLATPDRQTAIVNCMDPASEYYHPYTSDQDLDCDTNLRYCANLPLPDSGSTR